MSARSEDVVHTASGALRGRPRWEAWDARAATPYVQSFAPDAVAPVDDLTEHHCAFWSTFIAAAP